jgi:hypothetical protein
VLPLGPSDWNDLVKGAEYTLKPRNENASSHWKVASSLRIVRR